MKMFLLRKIQLVFAVTEENCKLRQDVTALLSGKEVKLAAACVWLVPEDPQDKIPVPLLEEGKGQICSACHPATD